MKIFDIFENIEVRESKGMGSGLFAKKDFKKDDLVFVQFGAIVDYVTDYTISLNENLKIEPRLPGGPGMYMNHSCEPNIGFKNLTLVVAVKDILAGEELFTHYGFLGYEYGHEKDINGKEKINLNIKCNCGTKNCTGKLRCYKYLPPELRLKYIKYIQPYLLDDIKYPYIKE